MTLLTSTPVYLRFNRAHARCQDCGADLADLERHPSVLPSEVAEVAEATPDDAELPPLNREDYCPACWTKVRDEGYFSFWLARRHPDGRQARADRRARKARLLDLLDRLDASLQEDAPRAADLSDYQAAAKIARQAAALPEAPEGQRDLLDARLYVAAHLLLQFKVLQWVGEERSGAGDPLLVFASPTLGREFRIRDVGPFSLELEAVRAEMESFLTSSWNPTGTA